MLEAMNEIMTLEPQVGTNSMAAPIVLPLQIVVCKEKTLRCKADERARKAQSRLEPQRDFDDQARAVHREFFGQYKNRKKQQR